MNSWPVEDVQTQFAKVIELARTEGPQTILQHGQPLVVVIAADEFSKLSPPGLSKGTLLDFFSPLRGSGINLARRQEVPRKIEL